MRPRELGVVLFTFFGLFLVYQGIVFFTGFAGRLVESRGLFDPYPWSLPFAALPALLGVGPGVICIVFRNRLSDRFFGDIDPSRAGPAPDAPEDWRAFWVGLIGVVFVVLALRDIAYAAATAIFPEVPAAESRAFEVWPPRIRLAVQLVLGLFLVLGAPGLVGAWTSLRSAGRIRE